MRSWWTAGYAPRLDTFMGPETPNPISVKVLRGNCSLHPPAVLSDALGLTKINFNWCLHNDRLPVTLRFANAVSTFSSQHLMDSEPKLPFKSTFEAEDCDLNARRVVASPERP